MKQRHRILNYDGAEQGPINYFGNFNSVTDIVTTYASRVSLLMMNISSLKSPNIFVRFSRVALLLGIAMLWLVSAGSVMAQENGAAASPVPENAGVNLEKRAVTSGGTDKSTVTAQPAASAVATDYKSSLNSLATLYQNEVQKLQKQNSQSKDLYGQGLISRVEMETSDKSLADARAKVEEVARQIAEANKPAPAPVTSSSDLIASNQVWSTGNTRVDGLIRYYGNNYGVDPYLIYCLMSQESKFSNKATSPKGAQGLMQLMPGTAARYGVTNPYDMAQSILGGTRYLKDLLKMFNGRVDLALAGYNAGENAVIKHGYTVPPYDETRNYVKLIIKRYGRTTTPEQKAKS